MHRLRQSPPTPILASILSLLLFAALASAQNGTAEISGHVQDPSGAPVAKTHLAVRNVDTGISRDASANDEGNYVVPALEPGSYEVLVEHAGFRTVQRSGITLHVNDSVRLVGRSRNPLLLLRPAGSGSRRALPVPPLCAVCL